MPILVVLFVLLALVWIPIAITIIVGLFPAWFYLCIREGSKEEHNIFVMITLFLVGESVAFFAFFSIIGN